MWSWTNVRALRKINKVSSEDMWATGDFQEQIHSIFSAAPFKLLPAGAISNTVKWLSFLLHTLGWVIDMACRLDNFQASFWNELTHFQMKVGFGFENSLFLSMLPKPSLCRTMLVLSIFCCSWTWSLCPHFCTPSCHILEHAMHILHFGL